ncbi:MAG TPA: RDD family protein, partial [Bacteroidales bacterium]|nr:RDD family protein [Bacteroidales bacterium]
MRANLKSHFFRRFFAVLIDFAAIWCVASLIQQVSRFTIFIPFGDLLAGSFIGYYLLSYRLFGGRTPGRIFTGLKLTGKNGEPVSLPGMLLREVLLKGIVGLLLPLWLFTVLPKATVFYFTAFKMMLILLFSALFLLVFRQTWWEWLSGTKTELEKGAAPSRLTHAFLTLIVLDLATIALAILPFPAGDGRFGSGFRNPAPANGEVRKYEAYVRDHRMDPVDYLFHLFEKYDLVVISERMHPEYSQYEFIFRVLDDPRFASEVGHIFTECGSVSWQDSLDAYLRTPYPEQDLLKATARLARDNNAVWPLWSNTNLFDMFRKVHELNAALPDSGRIRWYFTDLPVNWATATHASYLRNFTDCKRDEIMANRVIDVYRKDLEGTRRHKALVIMSTYHGFGLAADGKDYFHGTTARIMKELPGKVATVLMNGVAQQYLWIFTPVAGGKWDAAFSLAGDPPSGLDFAGSPFGDDLFDGRGSMVRGLRY